MVIALKYIFRVGLLVLVLLHLFNKVASYTVCMARLLSLASIGLLILLTYVFFVATELTFSLFPLNFVGM